MNKFKISIIVLVAGLLMLLSIPVMWALDFGLFAANTARASAKGVVSKTLAPEHVIFQYEHFHDLCHDVLALNQQIVTAQHTIDLASKPDSASDPFGIKQQEYNRLQTNLEALQNQRDNAAQSYNADSHKLNDSIFKSHSLPSSIDPPNYTAVCEQS